MSSILTNREKQIFLLIKENYKIRRINVSFNNVHKKRFEQLDIFGKVEEDNKELKIEKTINNLKKKYGKNSILRGVSYLENANQINRNKMIGGHNAGS